VMNAFQSDIYENYNEVEVEDEPTALDRLRPDWSTLWTYKQMQMQAWHLR
jgi:hypothetical protein